MVQNETIFFVVFLGKGAFAMERGKKLVGMEENLAVVMMRVRRSVRTALRDAVREVGLTQNEIGRAHV